MKLKVASIQFDTLLGSVPENLDKAERLIHNGLTSGAQLIVLPELFNTGYRLDDQYEQYAESIPGPSVERISAVAQKEKVYLVGCIAEKDPSTGNIFDTAFLTGPDGFIGAYRKIHLWGQEPEFFHTGPAFPVFPTPWCKIGLLICYDVGFPEAARCLALAGAEMILLPSAFGMPRLYAWDLATRSRALENGCYLVAANRIGREKDSEFCGHSRVVDPQGNVIVDATLQESVIVADVDISEVHQQRERIPYLRDRRPDLYGLLCAKPSFG
jgi:predicted amidohydrolase